MIKKISTIVILLVSYLAQSQETRTEPLSIGHSVTIHSSILDEDRILNIYIPEEYYMDSISKFPVVYLLDGSMDEDFLHTVGLFQFMSFSWLNYAPSCIIVGISNTDRKRDFTYPSTDEKQKTDFPTTGGSEKFISFLQNEVQPLIEKSYRLNGDKILIGQSLGGLLATEILLKKPELFTHYMIVSPSLWWDHQSLLKLKPKIPEGTKIHISVGAKEHKIMRNDAKSLYSKLKRSQNLAKTSNLSFKQMENRDHANILHQALYDGLPILFKVDKKK